jgi:crotonobetainyl-CoA:carnitine CoA-transferase CaiB-like acyl-CoA transferase
MLPLEGLRVLALEQYGAGPHGTMYLGDLGAEVIKIENPAEGGDMARGVGPYHLGPADSHFFQSFNRNKRSVTLDLKRPGARNVLRALVRDADALFHNLRGDQPALLGLTYEDFKDVNPRLVCAHLTAYGRFGSRAAWPGYDYLMQAEAGYLALTGEPEGPPARFGLSVVDYMTGLAAAFGLLAGVLSARATGQGRDIDVSLFDLALSNLGYLATWYLNEGLNQRRLERSAHPSLSPSQLFRTKDGWLFLMCNKEKFWGAFARKIGRPQWASDPDFKNFAARLKNRERLSAMIEAVLIGRTTAEWLDIFAGTVPAAPVLDVAEALDNPFVEEMGMVQNIAHPSRPDFRMLRAPIRCPGEGTPARPGPALGADTDAILRRAGYGDAEIKRLREAKVI